MKPQIICLLVSISVLMGCDPRSEKDVPPRPMQMVAHEDFVAIHAQLQLVETAHRQHMLKGDRERSRALHRARILAEVGVTDSAFTATFNWWYSQPEAMPGLLQEVQLHLDSLAKNSTWN